MNWLTRLENVFSPELQENEFASLSSLHKSYSPSPIPFRIGLGVARVNV
jgi:hypothetical protein